VTAILRLAPGAGPHSREITEASFALVFRVEVEVGHSQQPR
jgi:hypothetical protein